MFKVIWPAEEDNPEDELSSSEKKKYNSVGTSLTQKKKDSTELVKKEEKTGSNGGKVAAVAVGGVIIGALTAGIGLLAGMMVVGLGAVAGGSAVALSNYQTEKEKTLVLACDSYQEAERWVNVIEAQTRALANSSVGSNFIPGRINRSSRKHEAPSSVRLEEVEDWVKSSKWRVWTVDQGLRIFEQVLNHS